MCVLQRGHISSVHSCQLKFFKKKKKITPIKKTIMPSLFKKKKEKEKEKGKQITNLKTEILSFIYIYF